MSKSRKKIGFFFVSIFVRNENFFLAKKLVCISVVLWSWSWFWFWNINSIYSITIQNVFQITIQYFFQWKKNWIFWINNKCLLAIKIILIASTQKDNKIYIKWNGHLFFFSLVIKINLKHTHTQLTICIDFKCMDLAKKNKKKFNLTNQIQFSFQSMMIVTIHHYYQESKRKKNWENK